jgi:integrase
MKLTEQIVAGLALRPGERERLVADDAMTGLRLRLRAGVKGVTKTWVYKYSRGGQSASFTFDLAGHSLAAARKRAGELQARLRLGQDPAQTRREGKTRAAETMSVVLLGYLEQKRLALRPSSYCEVERHLMTHCKPLHRHPLRAITPAMVASRYAGIATASGPGAANNVLRSLHAFCDWALRHGYLERNPAAGVERRPGKKRERVLTASEIKAIWQATAGTGDFNAIVRLLLLTGCRITEIGSLRWDEIYSDRIIIPGERTKNARTHVIPLLPAMHAVLDGRPRRGDYVFGIAADRPFTGWSSSKRVLDSRIATAVAPWTLHDLRRTFVTGACELGIAPHIIETAVNHISGFKSGVAGHYNFAALEGPVRHALAVWEAHVLSIARGDVQGDRVVPLPLRAS